MPKGYPKNGIAKSRRVTPVGELSFSSKWAMKEEGYSEDRPEEFAAVYREDVMAWPNIGKKRVREIEEWLAARGVTMRTRFVPSTPKEKAIYDIAYKAGFAAGREAV